jgi:hypothetical protein
MHKEALAEQPLQTGEYFDRYLRTYHDATTWLAETLNGSMRTPFEYQFDGQDLYASDGSNLRHIFEDALADVTRLQRDSPQIAFELRRRQIELEEYYDMLAMANGDISNTMVVISDFPPELMFANTDVGGYNVERKQTMLRVLTWRNGRMTMYSQSLDGSDRTALESIYGLFGKVPKSGELLGQRIHIDLSAADQEHLTDRLTGIYDRTLTESYGGNWYAGRQEAEHDTYQFVLSQRAVIDRFVSAELIGGISEYDKYNIAALLSERFEYIKRQGIAYSEVELAFTGIMQAQDLDWQLRIAGDAARADGKTFSGCGISADGLTAAEQLSESGYGGNQSEDADCEYISKSCPSCGTKNVRTVDKRIIGSKRRISGSCGCSKNYVKAG